MCWFTHQMKPIIKQFSPPKINRFRHQLDLLSPIICSAIFSRVSGGIPEDGLTSAPTGQSQTVAQ